MTLAADPRSARSFRFVRREYADGVVRLVYAFDDGPELVETLRFPEPPPLAPNAGPRSRPHSTCCT